MILICTANNKKPKKRMLTFEQLSDLFRRLDRDGNGELDLEEFLQVIIESRVLNNSLTLTCCSS